MAGPRGTTAPRGRTDLSQEAAGGLRIQTVRGAWPGGLTFRIPPIVTPKKGQTRGCGPEGLNRDVA